MTFQQYTRNIKQVKMICPELTEAEVEAAAMNEAFMENLRATYGNVTGSRVEKTLDLRTGQIQTRRIYR